MWPGKASFSPSGSRARWRSHYHPGLGEKLLSRGNKRMREQDIASQLATKAHYILGTLPPDALHFSLCSHFPHSLTGVRVSLSLACMVFSRVTGCFKKEQWMWQPGKWSAGGDSTHYTFGGKKMCITVMEKCIKIAQKTKSRSTIWASFPTPGNVLKGNNISMCKSYLYFHTNSSLTHNT